MHFSSFLKGFQLPKTVSDLRVRFSIYLCPLWLLLALASWFLLSQLLLINIVLLVPPSFVQPTMGPCLDWTSILLVLSLQILAFSQLLCFLIREYFWMYFSGQATGEQQQINFDISLSFCFTYKRPSVICSYDWKWQILLCSICYF